MISKKNIYSLEKTTKFFQEFPVVLIYQHNNLRVKQHIDLKVQLQQLDNVKTLTVKNSIVEKVCLLHSKKPSFLEPKKRSLLFQINSVNFSRKMETESKKDTEKYNNYTENKKISSSIKFLSDYKDINNYAHTDKITANQLETLLQGPVFLLGCYKLEEFRKIWDILKTSSSFLFLGGQFNNQIYTHLDIQKSLELNKSVYYELFNIFDQQLNFQNSFLYNKFFSILESQKLKIMSTSWNLK